MEGVGEGLGGLDHLGGGVGGGFQDMGGRGRGLAAVVAGAGGVVELEILAEHGEEVFFEAHDEGVNPGVEEDVRAFEPHLRRVAGGEVLDVDGGRDHGAGDAEALGDVAFHLGAEDQFRGGGDDGGFDVEVVVGDEGFEPVVLGAGAHGAGEFAVVAAEADDLEADLVAGDAGGGHGVGGVAEDEDTLAGEVGAVDGGRPPGLAEVGFVDLRADVGQLGDLGDEFAGGLGADGDGFGPGLGVGLFQPAGGGFAGFGVEEDVEMGGGEALQVLRRRIQRGGDVYGDAHLGEEFGDFGHIVAVAEAQGRRAEDVAGDFLGALLRYGQGAGEGEEGLVRAEVFLAGVAGEVEGHDGAGEPKGRGEAAGVVLDQLGRAGGADDHRLRLEAVIRALGGALEEGGGVGTEVGGLEGGEGDRRAVVAPLDHREEEVGVGVALWGVEDVVDVLHARGDAHRADVRGAFVGPEGEFHSAAPCNSARRRRGREKRAARSPACS